VTINPRCMALAQTTPDSFHDTTGRETHQRDGYGPIAELMEAPFGSMRRRVHQVTTGLGR